MLDGLEDFNLSQSVSTVSNLSVVTFPLVLIFSIYHFFGLSQEKSFHSVPKNGPIKNSILMSKICLVLIESKEMIGFNF